MVRMQIQFTEEQVAGLRREAARLGVSQAELVRRALDSYLGPRPITDRTAIRERARAVIGAFQGHEGDIGRRHDDYLAEMAHARSRTDER